jgi:mannose-6-phosphate isomerase-like protein (cupin superfamily)
MNQAKERISKMKNPKINRANPPWGKWEVILEESTYKVKRVTVLPGKRLSYQKHFKRQEHWNIVEGSGLVTLDGKQISLTPGENITIPCEAAHRITNLGESPLVFIEIQQGSYCEEDDILRLEDDYGRIEKSPPL